MKCKVCEQEAWSGTEYCPKHDMSFKERKYNMLQEREQLELIRTTIKNSNSENGIFCSVFTLYNITGENVMQVSSEAVLEWLNCYIKHN